eukprot:Lankesteria_metandrocarpae@DN5475_c1_g1_i1.p1
MDDKVVASIGKPLFSLTVCNVGDSRAFLLKPDGRWFAMTRDHSPNEPIEQARIENAGGKVVGGRINSQMAVSRAFGDRSYKTQAHLGATKQLVVSLPDIRRHDAEPGDFVIMACDGIFETFSNQSLMTFVYNKQLSRNFDLEDCAIEVVDHALLCGSMDNLTVHIIQLLPTLVRKPCLTESYLPAIIFGEKLGVHSRFEMTLLSEYNRVGVDAKKAIAVAVKAPEYAFLNNYLLNCLGQQRKGRRIAIENVQRTITVPELFEYRLPVSIPHTVLPSKAPKIMSDISLGMQMDSSALEVNKGFVVRELSPSPP